jgi:hypothetical protein
MSLMRGDVPGRAPDRQSVHWLERAAELSQYRMGGNELAEALLEGAHIPQDIPRGLAVYERALLALPKTSAIAWELAVILHRGMYGVARDPARALALVMPQAPWWRRLLAGAGIDQTAWLDNRLQQIDAIKAELDDQSPWETQRMMQGMVSGLRNS